MKLLTKINDSPDFHVVNFQLTSKEFNKELKLMNRIENTTIKILLGELKMSAIHELSFKRDISLKDGRVLIGAWCSHLCEDTKIGTFIYDRVLTKEEVNQYAKEN